MAVSKKTFWRVNDTLISDVSLYAVMAGPSCWVSKGRYWLVVGGTGSVKGGTGLYLVALGQ